MSGEQERHDEERRARGAPWCDRCGHAAVWREGQGWLHSTPSEPFGLAHRSDPADHLVTARQWDATLVFDSRLVRRGEQQ